ncbi:MAG: cytochrome c biogenesis protein CcdA [Coriobacteriia bacterium]|nr:cytochrome c biogenesis protein CcdA [Actinomycetota bacterium]MDZ4167162.1 cytochrome c biogenesis protein CcdA [Coriobacteriia bacterium]
MNIEALASQLTSGDLGGIAAFSVAFLGGIVAGFGPCVVPVLPAVFGYVTGMVVRDPEDEAPRVMLIRALGLTAVFVVGMSLVFSVIGALAGLLGRALMFGAWAYYVIAIICVAIALQMLGVIEIPFDRLNRFLPAQRPERKGIIGALLFGMLFGLVASPCSTPILAAIAAIAATTGSAAEGGAMLFVYGLGKGVPLMLLGLASGSLGLMRKVSRLTPVFTKIGGAGLLGAAAYLVWIA